MHTYVCDGAVWGDVRVYEGFRCGDVIVIYLYSAANPLGIAVAFLASPHLVVQSADVFTLSWVYLIPAVVGVVLTVLTFWRNRPPTPPSLAAEHKQDSFFKGVKSVCECLCECMCVYLHMYQSVYLCVCECACVHLCTPLPLFSLFPSPFPSTLSPFPSPLSTSPRPSLKYSGDGGWPMWEPNPNPFQCEVKDPEKKSKYRGIKSFIAYTVIPDVRVCVCV